MIQNSHHLRLQNLAYSIIILLGAGYILYVGSSLIIPFTYAILIAVFLYPIDKKVKKLIKVKSLSILVSYLVIILPLIAITTLFSFQLISIIDSLPSINENMQSGFDKILAKINDVFPFLTLDSKSLFGGEGQNNMEGPVKFIGQGLISTTEFMAALGMTTLYSFFLLYYRDSIKNFIVYQFSRNARSDIDETLTEIKETIQSYIGGIGVVMIILSILNSIGLSLIGIKYAIFWGVLAGLLAIIPYIGTMLGGFLPFIYALATADAQWQPIAVVVYYIIIQQVEGNFITPKIVGAKVDINPLFAIISLVFFGTFWGIGGVVLALPIISIVKILLSHFETTLPYAILMSSDISKKTGIFKKIATR